MDKIKVGIIGPGNIGTDLMYKVRRSQHLEMCMMAGIVESEGLKRAAGFGYKTSIEGVHAIAKEEDVQIVFDATSAKAHLYDSCKTIGDANWENACTLHVKENLILPRKRRKEKCIPFC